MRRLAKHDVDLVVFDFDGVLTDNRVLVMDDGREAVLCNRADGLAFDRFRTERLPTAIMSTERNPVVSARAAKLKTAVLQSIADKGAALAGYCRERGADPHRVVFVGNDVNDLPAMRLVGYPIAVADAHPDVKAIAWTVLKRRGGEGVARELADDVFGFAEGDRHGR
jgi:YrbI family 3-deoxy-D-manno-octulosonate 8-phosphate phosphatase